MKFVVQTDRFNLLKEAVDSNCSSIRFGSEFCEVKMPNLSILEKAYKIVNEKGKKFIYITPRLSNNGITQVKKQLTFLNKEGAVSIVVNDLGTLNLLEQFPKLEPYLGRQLIRVPARFPFMETVFQDGGFFSKRWFNKVFSSMSINYSLTMDFFWKKGVKRIDIDWIPHVFPSLKPLTERGFSLSVHLHLVPVTLTRKCHTARFLGEKVLKKCSLPCLNKAYLLKNVFNQELYLHGNVVFSLIHPDKNDFKKFENLNNTEFVLTMNPITDINNKQKINDLIGSF